MVRTVCIACIIYPRNEMSEAVATESVVQKRIT